MVKDRYSGINAAHACAKNGHAGILSKIIEYEPALAKAEDN